MLNNLGAAGLKRFKLSLGAGQGDALFAGGLALIIILSLGATIYYSFFASSSASAGSTERHYQCAKCQHEFTIDAADIPPELVAEANDPAMVRLDCPSCNAKRTAFPQTECPNCKKYFIRPTLLHMDRIMRGETIRDVCPYCQTDLIKWHRDQLKKK